MPVKLPESLVRELHELHLSGVSLQEIEKTRGYSRVALAKRLRAMGLPVRGRAEGATVRHAKMTSAERAANVEAAHAARRGQVDSDATKAARAFGRTHDRIGMYELEVIEYLRQQGVGCTGQFPVGPYNLDIFVHVPGVAVEIYSVHPGGDRLKKIRERTKYLLDLGFHGLTIQLNYPARVFDLAAVGDKVIAFAEFCRRNQTGRCHHGVIGGHGQIRAVSRHQVDDWPLVTSF